MPASSAELSYDALMLLDVAPPPSNAYKDITKEYPLVRFDCGIGRFKTACILPRYTYEQMPRLTEFDGYQLSHFIYYRISETEYSEDLMASDFIDKIPIDDIYKFLASNRVARHQGGVFEFGPIPVFPSASFRSVFADDGTDTEVATLKSFDLARFTDQVARLTIDDLVEYADYHPIWHSVPMSYEPVTSALFESAWETWDRLAIESNQRCPYDAVQCDDFIIVHTFINGPEEMNSGFAVCENPDDEPVHLASGCTIMAYSTPQGGRFVKALYGPSVGVEAGGFINSAGIIELTCSREETVDRPTILDHLKAVLTKAAYRTEVSGKHRFGRPDKILVAINEGRQLADFDNKFVFLHVSAYDDGIEFGFWLSIAARAWLRAEPEPSRYPVFSETEAIRLGNLLAKDFGEYGYECEAEG